MKPVAASGHTVRLMMKPNLTSQKRRFRFWNESTIFDMMALLLFRCLFRLGGKRNKQPEEVGVQDLI
jgi:hypothetical protein